MRVYRTGFPHSEISGSKVVCTSPKLIAAGHVLHRLPMPRHPPYALSSLLQRTFQRRYTLALTRRVVKERIWFLFYQKKSGFFYGGDNRARTGNLRRARAALSQLSYIPGACSIFPQNLVGLDRFELSTSRLSGVRSNQLRYRP